MLRAALVQLPTCWAVVPGAGLEAGILEAESWGQSPSIPRILLSLPLSRLHVSLDYYISSQDTTKIMEIWH